MPKTPPEIRVVALKGHLPRVEHDGSITMGRGVGRVRGAGLLTPDGTEHPALPEGEMVPDTAYYHRAIANGSLRLATDADVAVKPAEPAASGSN